MADSIDCLRKNVNKILSTRDKIGATLKPVSILVRTWSGQFIGDGSAETKVIEVKPTPRVRPFAHDLRIPEGGAIKQGDILLKGISKESFPDESQIDGSSGGRKNVEVFYQIGENLYQVIQVREKFLTWDVQVRRLSDQTRFE